MSDLIDCGKDTAPLLAGAQDRVGRQSAVKEFPEVGEIIKAKDQGVFLPRSVV